MENTVIITGGAGFIGSALIRHLIRATDLTVVNVDCLTYAGNLASLTSVQDSSRYHLEREDIRDLAALRRLFDRYRPRAVSHLAAESHVDRSIDGPAEFVQTNVVGTFRLLEAARDYFEQLSSGDRRRFRFHHVSTDEVYGSLGDKGVFHEGSSYSPNSPYAASKAASDHFARAWGVTYGLPVLVTNSSNNYGPYQFPEKLIPHMILSALEGQELPVYGDGENVRDWLYVEDHARALRRALQAGEPGETYLVGGRNELRNIEVVQAICDILDEKKPREEGRGYRKQIRFVEDRPGHDYRYAVDPSKIETELAWSPVETFESGLEKTVDWYLENESWWREIRSGQYRGERLGLLE